MGRGEGQAKRGNYLQNIVNILFEMLGFVLCGRRI
jgi:hypothetical protein